MIGDSYYEHKELYRKLVIIVLSVVVVLPLMMPRAVSFLEIPGFVSFLSVAYVILTVVILYGKDRLPINTCSLENNYHYNDHNAIVPSGSFPVPTRELFAPNCNDLSHSFLNE